MANGAEATASWKLVDLVLPGLAPIALRR